MKVLPYDRALKQPSQLIRKHWENWILNEYPVFSRYAVLTHPWPVTVESAFRRGRRFLFFLNLLLFGQYFQRRKEGLISLFTVENGFKLRNKLQNPHINLLLQDHPELENLLIQNIWADITERSDVNVKILSIPDKIPLEKAVGYTLKEVNNERVPFFSVPGYLQHDNHPEPLQCNTVKGSSFSPERFSKPSEPLMLPPVSSIKSGVVFPFSINKIPRPCSKKRQRKRIRLDFRFKDNKLTTDVNFRQRNGCWYIRFTLNGKQWERSTGEVEYDKALLKTSEIVNEVARAAELGVSGETREINTLSDLARKYEPFALTTKAATTTDREQYTMRILLMAFGDMKLHEITCQGIELYMQKRTQEVQNASINRELALLRHMLNKAVDWNYLKVNPASRVKPLKEPPGRDRYLSESEQERLLDSCTGTLKAIVLTALLTGMRKGELEALTWDDVDLEQGEIVLKRTKNNEKRFIPISSELLPVLQSLRNENPYSCFVFSKPDGTAYGNCRKGFETACKHAGITNFHFHDLRHTFASTLLMKFVDPITVQRLLGHKTMLMTMRYVHLSKPHLRAAVDKIRAGLGQALKSPDDSLASDEFTAGR